MPSKRKYLKKTLIFFISLTIVFCLGYYSYDIYHDHTEKQTFLAGLDYQGAVLAHEAQNTEMIRQEIATENHIREQLISGNYDPDLKVAFLTFDDGPNASSNEVLDILKKYNVKATFFTNGSNGNSDPAFKAIYKRYIDEGHVVGNHTFNHLYSLYKNPAAFYENITQQENFIREATGKEPVKIFRFPGGSNMTNRSVVDNVRAMGYNYYDWNATVGDGATVTLSPELAVQKVFTELKDQQVAVVLMHAENPAKASSRQALPMIIERFQSMGYRFMTIDPSYNLPKFVQSSY